MRTTVDFDCGDRLKLTAYLPEAPSGAIFLLTGGFQGDESGQSTLAESLYSSGFAIFSANLALDSVLNGMALNDAVAAIRWLLASEYEFERDRLAVMGVGVGGTVAIEVGLREGIPVVAWSAQIDFRDFMDNTASLGDSDHLRNYDGMNWATIVAAGEQVPFLRGIVLSRVANNLSLLTSTSPLTRITPDAGRMLLFNSANEIIPSRGMASMQKAMAAQGVPCTVSLLEGTEHGAEYALSALPSTIQFFRDQFCKV
ncbi:MULTISPECIES: alpha/beta hydrolase family protein [unclassified Rhizobium]|uniref:alpha/beta hydrolase fold domain-containing protein n=1 Tax=Rhizobium sp. 16-488-2b TaxID=2819991 RepID=UPI001ADA0EF2|nr:alpha/beta hydrolase fold domain-containing protein [Rhizobium sp. 16-488-2b]